MHATGLSEPSIRYFRATVDDLALVIEERLEVLAIFQGVHPPEAVEAIRPHITEALREGLKDETYICWIAEVDGKVAGSGGMSIRRQPGNFTNPTGRTGYIMNMYTRTEFRGRGICSELVRKLIETGKEMGISHFELHATPAGEQVYKKMGFQLHPEPTYRMKV